MAIIENTTIGEVTPLQFLKKCSPKELRQVNLIINQIEFQAKMYDESYADHEEFWGKLQDLEEPIK